jgi:PAS domain S-box-containing protein
MKSDRPATPSLADRLFSSRSWGLTLAVAIVYFLTAKLGLRMAFVAAQVTVVWPPSGISLAAVLIFGQRIWPGIALGAFVANATTSASLAASLCIAMGNTLEALCGAWMLHRLVSFTPSLDRLRDVLGLTVLAAGLSTMVSATIGVTSLCVAAGQPWSSYGQLWWVWWLGDATSDLVVSPLLLTATARRWRPWAPRRVVEALTFVAALAVVSVSIFGGPERSEFANGLAYSVFPFIIWAALRFGPRGSAAVTFFISAVAIWGRLQGLGQFASGHVSESLILVQLFMAVVTVTGLFLAAAVAESRRAEQRASAQYETARILAACRSREEMLRPVLECVRAELECDFAAFWITDEPNDFLRIIEFCSKASVRLPRFETEIRNRQIVRGVGLPGHVWATAEPAWHTNVPDDKSIPPPSASSHEGIRGALAVPILVGGEVFGVMEFFARGTRAPDQDLLEMTAAIGRQIGQFIERRSAEESLARNRETLELAQDVAQAGTFVWNIRTGELSWSESQARLYGLPGDRFQGKYEDWKQAVHPEDRQRVEAEVAAAVELCQPLDTEYRIIRPDGVVRSIAARGRVFLDAAGMPLRMIGINIDITQRKAAEVNLERSEERYRTFIRQSSEGIWRCEMTQPIRTDKPEDEQIEDFFRFSYLGECNDAMARMYGFSSAAEIIGARLGELLPQSDEHNILYLRRFVQSGYRLNEAESHEIDREGNPKYYLNNLVGIVEDGCLVRAWGTQRDVTEQRRVEEERRKSEEKFRSMVETANEGIWILDTEARITFINQRMAEILGYEPEELLGRRMWELVFDEDQMRIGRLFERRRAGVSEQADVRFRRKNGHEVWTILSARSLSDDRGEFGGALDLFTDVTERRKAEEALRENEERLRLAMEAGEIGAWEWDVANDRVAWSDRIYAIHGLQPGTFGGHVNDFVALVHPTDADRVKQKIQRALDQDEPYRIEFRILRPDGDVRWIATSAAVLRDGRGMPLRMLGAAIDTTERKLVEEALRKSEEFRRRILDSTRDWVKVLTLSGNFLSTNDAGLAALEIDDLATVLNTSWIDVWRTDQREEARRAVDAAANGSVGRFQGFLPTQKTHTPKWWDVVISPILGSDKQPVQLLAVSRDLTDQKRMENALRDADRRKDEFLAMLAHELRNPLSAISSAAILAQQPHFSEQDRRWTQEVIQRQVKHLSRLIDDLLDISRITRGKIQLRQELLDAGVIIEQAVESVRPLIEERGHHLELIMSPGGLPIMGDGTRVEQIVVNLLTNAAKYTEAGGIIRLTAQQLGTEVIIRIRDTGVGIAPEKISEMFELFAQGDRSLARSEGGLGIGLTLVKRLTEMQGGSVSGQSEGPGKGSEFVVRLPLAQTSVIEAAGAAARGEAHKKRTRVLVVDDNVDAAAGLAVLLKFLGHEVEVAYDGPSAIAQARILRPDVILLDLGLPGMDGYQVAAELRRDGVCKETLLIAVTGYGQEDDLRRSQAAGFDHHLVKPVDFEALTSLMANPSGSSLNH